MKIKISDFLKNYLLENQLQYITKMNSFVEVVHMRWAPESWVSLSGLIKSTPATVLDPMALPRTIIPCSSNAAAELVSSSHCPVLSTHAPGEPGPPLYSGAASPCPYPQGCVCYLELPHCPWQSGSWECNQKYPFCQGCPACSTTSPYVSKCFLQPRADSLSKPNEPTWSPELIMNNLT